MDVKYSYSASIVGLLLLCCHLCVIECFEIKVREGDPIEFTLPGIKTCGHYTLLNPSLRPVVIVEGSNVTNLIDPYDKRATMRQTGDGFTLTLSQSTYKDAGEYTVAPSIANLAPPCISNSYNVNVTDAATSEEEYFRPWGEWTFCIGQCSHYRKRSRSRKCSLEGGCGGMGPTYQTETCDKAEHCPKWSSWGGWGECSAKCGKGFKIRKRVCLSEKSSLVRSSDCRGVSTQSHMCLTVCEVFGTWNEWSDWSNCTMTCGSDVTNASTNVGTRTRSRACSTDGQRDVTRNCTGNRTEEETCSAECTTIGTPSTENITEAVFVGVTEAATERNISIISVIAGSVCALLVVVVLIIVILLKKRVTRRRESVPTLRPAESANNRRKKISKERKSSAPQNLPQSESGNVYSEFSSNSFWPSSEFDSTYSLENAGFSRPSFGNVMEVIQDAEDNGETSDGFDSEFDDNLDVAGGPVICERKEIIYEKSRASCQRTNADNERVKYGDNQSTQSEDFVVTENECYEPPELWSNEDVKNSFGFDSLPRFGGVNNGNNGSNNQTVPNEADIVYYEPPIEDNVAIDDDASKRAETKRQESEMTEDSIYENCEANRGTITSLEQRQCSQDTDDDYYEIPENKNVTSKQTEGELIENYNSEKVTNEMRDDEPRFTKVNMRNGSVVSIDTRFLHLSKDDLDSEHTYVNENAVNIKDFYVTPKYTYGQEMKKSVRGSEHIYDIPKI